MAVSTEKISVYSLADLKNTSDDAIPAYLNSLHFTQSHILSDTRLALGYSAFAICAATFYWDYKLGFESTKYYTLLAVVLYTLLNGALTYWIWGVEKGSVYIGTNKSGDRVEISSKTEKHVPIYNLTITTYHKDHLKVPNTVTIKKPFTQWFDNAGHFVALPFQQMMASNVKVVGDADPGKVVEGKKKVVKVEEGESKSMGEKWASLLAESSGVSLDDISGASPAAATPGRKKRERRLEFEGRGRELNDISWQGWKMKGKINRWHYVAFRQSILTGFQCPITIRILRCVAIFANNSSDLVIQRSEYNGTFIFLGYRNWEIIPTSLRLVPIESDVKTRTDIIAFNCLKILGFSSFQLLNVLGDIWTFQLLFT